MSTLDEQKQYDGQQLATDTNGKTKLVRVTKDGYSVVDDVDNAGRNSFNGIFGSQLVASRNTYVSANFFYGIDTNAYIDMSTNLGGYDFDGNLLRVNTGASANSIGRLRTKEVLRYRAGRDAEALFTCIWKEPKEGLNQLPGVQTVNDGFFIGYRGLDFGVGIKKNGIITHWITQDNFNGDKLDGSILENFILNQQFMNIFRISYGYLGIAPTYYEVLAGEYGWVVFHKIDLTNTQAETHIENPYLPLMMVIENTTNTTNESIRFGSIAASTFNGGEVHKPDSTSREYTISTSRLDVSGTSVEETVLTVHNKDLFNGKKNYIKSLLLNISASVLGAKPTLLRVKKLRTPVTGTFIDVNTGNSTLEYSVDAIPTQTQLDNALNLFPRELSKEGSVDRDVSDYNFSLYPDEYAIFTFTSANTTDVKLSILESERF